IFILEPLLVSLIFGLHFVIFTFQMNAFESTVESSMHLSNQINSFSTVAISIGISIIFWYYNQLNFHQQELIKQQQAVLVEKNIQLMRQAHFDSLTGLCNRRHFVDKAETEIKRIQSCRESCCLLVLDIDDFKHINDMHGHPAGDSVLKKLSDLLIHQFRKTDWVGRMGGEEFAVILSGAEFEEAKKVADKVRRQIEQTVFEIEDKKIKITVSVGIAPINEETENFDDVYKKADQALYHAKEYGKNQVVVV
ncbi:MAG TPA: hypothetical protein DHN33_05105, partial [Eubacteriaceae bacterium]|nr:hypothetical protein [Eubacteriaceae bacterium]